MNITRNTRIKWIDCAKGIGIILVVLGHSERGLVSSEIAPASWKLGLDFYLYTFHMPLFVFLAGLNVPQSMKSGRQEFLLRKVPTIAWPYLLWSIIMGAILALMASHTNGAGKWSDILLIGWRPLGPFWFLYALFVYCIIAAILAKKPALLAITALLLFFLGEYLTKDSLIHGIAHFFLFFVAGILFSPTLVKLKNWHSWGLFLATGSAWICVTTLTANPLNHNYFSALALPSAVLGSAMIIILANNLRGSVQAFFCELGRAPMAIYVMHILATAGSRILISKLIPETPPTIHLLAGTIVGVAIPYATYLIFQKMDWMPFFGFGQNRTKTVKLSHVHKMQ